MVVQKYPIPTHSESPPADLGTNIRQSADVSHRDVHEHYQPTGSGACYPDRRYDPIPGNCRAEDSSLCAAPF